MSEPKLTAEQLFAKTIHFLKFRARSKHEVERYLKQKMGPLYDENTVREAIANLEQFNFLNDAAFAQQLADSLLKSGKGPKIIEMKLREKGLDRETIRNTLENLNKDMVREAAHAALTKKAKTLHETNAYKRKQVLATFLYSRGFDSRLAYELIDANGE